MDHAVRRFIIACLLPWFVAAAHARIIAADPDNYRAQLKALKPGDTLQLAPGEYRRGLPIQRMTGARDAPIVIRGPAKGEPAIFIARAGANTVSIVDSAHIHIRDLTLDGRDIPVDGVKAEGHARFAHHITLENLTIVNHGNNQQNVAISTKCPAWGWVIRGNRIHGAGTGMYLGNSNGAGAFYNGLIEYNLVTDPRGYAIQIKHQHARPQLDIAPLGRFVTIIRHNVLSKSQGGTQESARPNLLVGHWPLSGEGSLDEYLIYGNFLHDNPHEALFQGEGNIAFYNNVLVNPRGNGVHIQPHNDVPRHVRIVRNTIVTGGDPVIVRLREDAEYRSQILAANVFYSPRAAHGGIQSGNLAFDLEALGSPLTAGNGGKLTIDLYPRDSKSRCAPLDPAFIDGLIDADCDFNAQPGRQNYCGAYAGQGRNPGWALALEIKPRHLCGGG